MELFWDLAFTISLSLLLPLIFIKLLSVTPNFETNEKVAVTERDHYHGVESDSPNFETEKFVRIVGKIDEFRDNSILRKVTVPEIVDVRDLGKIDENGVYNEIEVVDLAENPVEETSHDCGLSVVEESDEGINIHEVEVELDMMEWESNAHKVEEVEISHSDRVHFNEIDESTKMEETVEDMGLLDEDDWEGIERTELEKHFGAAVVFVGSKNNANLVASLSNDVKMKLYGYYKIATQGPCREPQPMALKFTARAKWNAWLELGIMGPELAMERYVSLLSENIPDWMGNHCDENAKSVYDLKAWPQ